jgi:methyl-accepting chemotaxis protein
MLRSLGVLGHIAISAVCGAAAAALITWLVMRARLHAALDRGAAAAAEAEEARRRAAELIAELRVQLEGARTALAQAVVEGRRAAGRRGDADQRLVQDAEAVLARTAEADGGDGDADGLAVSAAETAAEALAGREKELRATLDGLTRRCELVTAVLQSAEGEDRMAGHKIDDLVTAATEALAAASAVDAAVGKVQSGAAETAELSAQVSTEAERGYRAVHRTLDEIERIRTTTATARERIGALDARAAGIGHIVKVIQEITEKTNLLALNASIIAAQAGEHGRSFAVVANEIKALAQRTAASTKEIAEQIRGTQQESVLARGAMDAGVAAVDEGFQVALSAGDALEAIRQAARAAQKQVGTMTKTLKQQAGVATQVVDAAARVSERAGSFQQAMRGQSGVLDRLRGALLDIQAGALEIAESMRGQTEGSAQAMETINRVVERLAVIRRRERELRRSVRTVATQLHEAGAGELAAQWASVEEAIEKLHASSARLTSAS